MTEEFSKNPMYKNINSSATINNTTNNEATNNDATNNEATNNDKQFLSILDEVINLFEKLKIS